MESAEKIRFALSAIRPMAQMTFPYLAGVFGILDEGGKGILVGSALRCVLLGRKALITSFHVIDQCGFAISAGRGAPPYVIQDDIYFEERSDLAIYFLPADFPDTPALSYWPEQRIDRIGDRIQTDYLFLHGFPGGRTDLSTTANGIVSPSLPYGCMQRLHDLPSDLKSFEFAVEFDPDGMATKEVEGMIDPHRLSGSPIWRIGASGRAAKDWSADWSLLVGIVTQWRPREKILVATMAKEIFGIIQQTNVVHQATDN